jgi:methyl-accepting chemotaxis protein
MVEEMNAAGANLAEESGRLSDLLAQFRMQEGNPQQNGSYRRYAA